MTCATHHRFSRPGSLAKLTAIRRASSFGQQISRSASARFNLEVEIAERLIVAVADDEDGSVSSMGHGSAASALIRFDDEIPP